MDDEKRLREAIITTLEKLGYQLKDSSAEIFLKQNNFSRNEIRILNIIQKFDNYLTCKEAAYRLALKKNNLSFFIKKLENKNYLDRRVNPQDKRYVYLCITKEGRKFLKKFNKLENNFFEKIFNGFSEPELYQFTAYLKRLSDIFA